MIRKLEVLKLEAKVTFCVLVVADPVGTGNKMKPRCTNVGSDPSRGPRDGTRGGEEAAIMRRTYSTATFRHSHARDPHPGCT